MNARDQLALFEPSRDEALRLVEGWLKAAQRSADSADRFDTLCMPGLAATADAATVQAVAQATVLAIYVDLLEVAGVE